jgi:hypothetical protein
LWHPVIELDDKAVYGGFPISDWHGPLLADVLQGQIKQFQ